MVSTLDFKSIFLGSGAGSNTASGIFSAFANSTFTSFSPKTNPSSSSLTFSISASSCVASVSSSAALSSVFTKDLAGVVNGTCTNFRTSLPVKFRNFIRSSRVCLRTSTLNKETGVLTTAKIVV